jgi:tRNA(Ile2) C34 agmatinyltransferase TiaS
MKMQCWYCHSNHMFPWESLGKDWFRCNDCGATYSDDPNFRKQKKSKKLRNKKEVN